MKNYSIVRSGNEYIVQAGEKSVLKIASRRRAARLINLAAELLDQQSALATENELSVDRDFRALPHEMAGPAEVP